MKKLMTLMLGMTLMFGAVATVFGQEQKGPDTKEGKKKGGKKGGKKKEETPKKSGDR
jgi:hypothetical protein